MNCGIEMEPMEARYCWPKNLIVLSFVPPVATVAVDLLDRRIRDCS